MKSQEEMDREALERWKGYPAQLREQMKHLNPAREGLRDMLNKEIDALERALSSATVEVIVAQREQAANGVSELAQMAMHTRENVLVACDDYLPMSVMEQGALYRVRCRNSNCGIWNEEQKGFEIARTKFSESYIFVEHHWDTGAPYGTARPYEKMNKEPLVFESEAQKLEFLLACREKLGSY
jgi:hypothetical protein